MDLDKAVEIASALEVATKNARDIQKAQHSSHTIALANQVMNKDKGKSTPRPNGTPQPKFGNKGQKVKCYRCGGVDRNTVDTGIKDVFPVEKRDTYLRCAELKLENQCVTIAHT